MSRNQECVAEIVIVTDFQKRMLYVKQPVLSLLTRTQLNYRNFTRRVGALLFAKRMMKIKPNFEYVRTT